MVARIRHNPVTAVLKTQRQRHPRYLYVKNEQSHSSSEGRDEANRQQIHEHKNSRRQRHPKTLNREFKTKKKYINKIKKVEKLYSF